MTLRIGKPSPALERDQDFVFRQMSDLVRDSDRADRAYDAIPETRQRRLISVDIARYLAPEFNSWSGRVRHTLSTSSPAGAYAHDRILRELALPRPRKRMLITAGGPGSGKTTALGGTTIVAELVFDNQFKDVPRAREILNAALDHGWLVMVLYVHREFQEIPRAVLERSQRTGRWNSLADLPRMHLDARRAFGELRTEYEDRGVFFQGIGNSKFSSPDRFDVYPFQLAELARDARERYIEINHDWQAICKAELEKAVAQGAICKELAEIVASGP